MSYHANIPTNVVVKPELLKWARQRVRFDTDDLAHALGINNTATVEKWERTGELKLGQLEKIAQKTYTPIGYLFLSASPDEKLPIPDYRTLSGERSTRPSPNLLDTIYSSQLRQDWYRDGLIASNADPVSASSLPISHVVQGVGVEPT